MRTKVIRALPPQPTKKSSVSPWLIGIGATSVIALGVAWPFLSGSTDSAAPATAVAAVVPVASDASPAHAPVAVAAPTPAPAPSAIHDPIAEIKAMARAAEQATPVTDSLAPDELAVPAAGDKPAQPQPVKPAVSTATPAKPAAATRATAPAGEKRSSGNAGQQPRTKAETPERLAATAQPRPSPVAEAATEKLQPKPKQEPNLRVGTPAVPLLVPPPSGGAPRSPSLALPPPPKAQEEAVALKPKQSLYEQVRSKLPAEVTEEQTTKPAVPDGVQLQSPKVAAVAGDVVYVRINPRQTVEVKVGASVPGLGVLRKVESNGAQFEKQFVPNM